MIDARVFFSTKAKLHWYVQPYYSIICLHSPIFQICIITLTKYTSFSSFSFVVIDKGKLNKIYKFPIQGMLHE